MKSKKNILVTGASGMLGSTLVNNFNNKYNVFATGRENFKNNPALNFKSFDLESTSFEPLLEWSNPDIIIHCGAITNGNYCQNNPKEAFEVNGFSLQKLIADCGNSKIIYISTDAVYPSSLHKARESDLVYPESIYGKSKELGEFFLLNSGSNFNIIRTTIVGLNINEKKSSFAEWIIRSSLQNKTIGLFEDVLFNPISIWDLTVEIENIIEKNGFPPVLNISGSEIYSKYQFGIKLLHELGLSSVNIHKESITNFKERARRANDQTLDVSLYQEITKKKLKTLEETCKSFTYYFKKIGYEQ